MSEYKIEKSIPLPTKNPSLYPLLEMKIGDSFFGADASIQNSVLNYAKYYKVRVTTRKVDGGIRVWRIG
jgi:hypothetical protein